jgi:pyrroloquinoline quinone (PQQ) biosynthesis protein C
LTTYRKLSPDAVKWFSHHSEVDLQHAERGLTIVEDFIAYYELSADEAQTIAEITMRENVFIRRYFGEKALASAVGRVEQ